MKITESQNGQIYPEDTFSHGAAHIYLLYPSSQCRVKNLFKQRRWFGGLIRTGDFIFE